jgi:hypothetical protein
MDQDRFAAACKVIVEQDRQTGGIGTLGEKTLHAVIKRYLEADSSWHEVKLGAFFVDVFTGDRVFEIQTRHFNKLNPKLAALLPEYPVTIVYPTQARKWLLWVDPSSGEVSRRRLSPRRGQFLDVVPELYRIMPHLGHANLSILILRIDLEEYRLLNGWSRDRKKGSWRDDRIPLDLIDECLLRCPGDYRQLLPGGLGETFSSADLAGCAKVSSRLAQTALRILLAMQVVEIRGKQGRKRLYRITQR